MRQEDQDSSSQNGRSPASVIAATGTVGGTEDGERKATAAGKAVRWRRRSAGGARFPFGQFDCETGDFEETSE